MAVQFTIRKATIHITDKVPTHISFDGNKSMSDGKTDVMERFAINMPIEDLAPEGKILMEKLMGIVVMPNFNRLNDANASGVAE